MTSGEALECPDDYFTGLDGLLQKLEERKSQKHTRFDPSQSHN